MSFCHQLQSKFLESVSGEQVTFTRRQELNPICQWICLTALFHPQQVIKNLLFVGKVIYLISPESDVVSPSLGEVEREQEEKDKDEEEGDEKDDRPPSLMWLIRKLSLMAKREAAYTPKVPLKVPQELLMIGAIVLLLGVCRCHRPCLDRVP